MPKAVAIWLIKYTSLSLQQIADFCKLYVHEVDNLQSKTHHLLPKNPIKCGYLSRDEIYRCEQDEGTSLVMQNANCINNSKHKKYTLLNKKNKKPNCIAWVFKHYPDAQDASVAKLIGSTVQTVKKIKGNLVIINEEHPLTVGLCTKEEFDQFVSKYGSEIVEYNHDPFKI